MRKYENVVTMFENVARTVLIVGVAIREIVSIFAASQQDTITVSDDQ